MSKYFDRNEHPLHKDDAVRIEGVGGDLEGAEGIIHSFYLMRDGKDRARINLAGLATRAVGVVVGKLVKIHYDGPEPIFDGLMPHAAKMAEVIHGMLFASQILVVVWLYVEWHESHANLSDGIRREGLLDEWPRRRSSVSFELACPIAPVPLLLQAINFDWAVPLSALGT